MLQVWKALVCTACYRASRRGSLRLVMLIEGNPDTYRRWPELAGWPQEMDTFGVPERHANEQPTSGSRRVSPRGDLLPAFLSCMRFAIYSLQFLHASRKTSRQPIAPNQSRLGSHVPGLCLCKYPGPRIEPLNTAPPLACSATPSATPLHIPSHSSPASLPPSNQAKCGHCNTL